MISVYLTLPPCLADLQVTRVDGEKLLPYRTQLVQTLQLTLRLRCKQGYSLACNLLHHILRSTALTYPTDYCSVPGGFNRPLQEYLPIKVLWMCLVHVRTFEKWRQQNNILDHCWSHEFSLPPFLFFSQDWGRPGDLWNLEIRWHVPSSEETAFVFYVLDLLLQPELQRLQRYAQGEQDMSRSEVKTALCSNGNDKIPSFCIDFKSCEYFLELHFKQRWRSSESVCSPALSAGCWQHAPPSWWTHNHWPVSP